MSNFQVSERSMVKRLAKRGHYDKETIYKILDEGIICHISFVLNEQPFIIPTSYVRVNDSIYIHGAKNNRMINEIDKGLELCLAVTHLDGYVLARSAFHHSMNYRSVVIFGKGKIVSDKNEKLLALESFTNHFVHGRWKDVRKPNEKELGATSVLKISIEDASAKIRTGPPIDDKEDYNLDVWAGVIPIETSKGELIKDDLLKSGIEVPDYLKNLAAK